MEYTRVSNDKNHSDKRETTINKANVLEIKENNYKQVLRQPDNMSFVDRIFGRCHEYVKELKG